jgi:hypothetical protein
MLSIYVWNVFQFFIAVMWRDIDTYVIGCKVTPITGPEAPFRVYVLVKMLKNYQDSKGTPNLVTAALTVLRAIYRQGIKYSLSSKAAKLVHSSSLKAAGKYCTIRLFVLVRKCNALVLGSLPKQGRHPVCTSSDRGVGIQGRMLSSITNSLRETAKKKKKDIVSPEEHYQNHNHLHVIFTQEKTYDLKTTHPLRALLIRNLITHLYTLPAPTYSPKTVSVKFALYKS